jgi:hypothetical protein
VFDRHWTWIQTNQHRPGQLLCVRCGSLEAVEVRIITERPTHALDGADLASVCSDCWHRITTELARQRSKGRRIKLRTAFIKASRAVIPDEQRGKRVEALKSPAGLHRWIASALSEPEAV